jgi:hypothetical protein
MADAEDEDEVLDPELAEVPLEPHAAAPNARPMDRTAIAGTLYVTVVDSLFIRVDRTFASIEHLGLMRIWVDGHPGCGPGPG